MLRLIHLLAALSLGGVALAQVPQTPAGSSAARQVELLAPQLVAFAGSFQDGPFWSHARVITNILRDPEIRDQQCYRAFREGDPDGDFGEASTACEYYPYIRQLFIGIQVAGNLRNTVRPGSCAGSRT